MKVSQEEIDAAKHAMNDCGWPDEGDSLRSDLEIALHAAYTVRKQRKAAKRERQRKEKDKQVVESVKPVDVRPAGCRFRLQDEGKPYPRSSCAACGATVMNMGKACRYGESLAPSKAPEWDGKFGLGKYKLRNGRKVMVNKEDGHSFYGVVLHTEGFLTDDVGMIVRWSKTGSAGEGWDMFDLIRPWPKGEQ